MRTYSWLGYNVSVFVTVFTIFFGPIGAKANDAADVLNLLRDARILHSEGQLKPALEKSLHALKLAREQLTPTHDLVSTALNNIGTLYDDFGQYSASEKFLLQALSVDESKGVPNNPRVAIRLNNLGLLYRKTRRLQEAEGLFSKALSIDRENGSWDKVAIRLNNLSLVYSDMRDFNKAAESLEKALKIDIQIRDKYDPIIGTRHINLAAVYRELGQFEKAHDALSRGLLNWQFNFGNKHWQLVSAYMTLALLLQAERRMEEAERAWQTAVNLRKQFYPEDHPAVAHTVDGLARVRAAQRRWSMARQGFDEAAKIYLKRLEIRDCSFQFDCFVREETSTESMTFQELMRSIYYERRDEARGDASLRHAFLAGQYIHLSRAAGAVHKSAVRHLAKDPAVSRNIRRRQDVVEEYETKGRELLQVRIGPQTGDSANRSNRLQLDLNALELKILGLDNELSRQFPEYTSWTRMTPAAISDLQDALRHSEALLMFVDLPTLDPIPEETFIWAVTKTDVRWLRSDLGTQALTDKVQALRCGLDDGEWEGIGPPARCNKLLSVGLPGEEDPLPFSFAIAHELYEALLGPVKDLIKDKHLLIVPSGPLTSLPFQVLVTEPPEVPIGLKYEDYRDVAWLVRTQAITVLPSVASLKALREFAKGNSGSGVYVGYGDPVLIGNPACRGGADAAETCPGPAQEVKVASRSPRRARGGRRSAGLDGVFRKGAGQEAVLTEVRALCPLPDTAQEIRCVAQSLGVPASEIRLKQTATEADIKGLNESGKLATYKVVHFATHGLVAGDVEVMAKRQGEPALVLTPPDTKTDDEDDNGLLTASEVAQLKLNADWVILSACNTAAGEELGAEALSGLARAFFYAGTRALLVSHWPVYSDAAVRLITGTFAELEADPKMGRAEAQRRAMVALLNDPSQKDNPHPAVWAPFVVVGEGGAATP